VSGKESNVSKKRVKKDENKRACSTTVNNDNAWKDELLKKVRELELRNGSTRSKSEYGKDHC